MPTRSKTKTEPEMKTLIETVEAEEAERITLEVSKKQEVKRDDLALLAQKMAAAEEKMYHLHSGISECRSLLREQSAAHAAELAEQKAVHGAELAEQKAHHAANLHVIRNQLDAANTRVDIVERLGRKIVKGRGLEVVDFVRQQQRAVPHCAEASIKPHSYTSNLEEATRSEVGSLVSSVIGYCNA